ncbi:MAG: hypothetical protein ACI4GD_07740 [Lachnospiraceae bacterium]
MKVKVGTFAKSKAGHDWNQIYVIIDCDDEYVYLADGKNRTVDRPKKKKIKHIQPILCMNETIRAKIENNNLLSNEEIKKAIKDYKAED